MKYVLTMTADGNNLREFHARRKKQTRFSNRVYMTWDSHHEAESFLLYIQKNAIGKYRKIADDLIVDYE